MGKFWRKIRFSAVMIMVLCLLTGCGTGAATPASPAEDPGSVDVSIPYHADDEWAYDPSAALVAPIEDKEGAEEKEKAVITVVNSVMPGMRNSLQDAVTSFNNENSQYYVELEGIDIGNALADASLRLQMEISAGGGPDIMTADVFEISRDGLEKGLLVDLTPYLEASGITEEKYFPGYAPLPLRLGEKIFGISPVLTVSGYKIDKKVLGGDEVPDRIEVLVDKLLAYPERASFFGFEGEGQRILNYFLGGSENLWGMVDWENGKCDFSGELFSKMLETACRYQEDAKMDYEPVMGSRPIFGGIYQNEEELEKEGKKAIDFYFDDGRFPTVSNYTTIMFINKNTEHLDGAWAFLSYLMTRKGQNYFINPVHRELYDEMIQSQLQLLEYGGMQTALPFTQEKAEEIVALFDRARYLPNRADRILDIIYEESESYFSGDKSKDEVIDIIQNRVQLYLNER